MPKASKKPSARGFSGIPEKYRRRFEDERLETNIGRMQGFAIYIVALQVVLQVTNVIFSQGEGESMRIPLILLGNAVKFTREDGSVDFTVLLERETETGAEVFFTVRDMGIGMTAGQMEKLFTPFEQGSVNSMKHGGTGLGLAIAQSLVQMMGGKISVKSVPEKGSAFSFCLNFEKVSALEETGEPAVPNLSGKRILSVEDIEINRIVLDELLAETRAAVDEAIDGVQAIEKFKASP
ncbi:MAG: hypothetical protein LBB98_00360 [Treponema sp.]|nr:hypothetical protein [Treponema sp.]